MSDRDSGGRPPGLPGFRTDLEVCPHGKTALPEYADDVATVRDSRPDLAGRLAGFRTLEHVLDWLKTDGHPLSSLDMVTQDEYCHDLLVPVGADWLVFGMT